MADKNIQIKESSDNIFPAVALNIASVTSATVSGTTDASGFIKTSYTNDGGLTYIVGARASGSSYTCLPFLMSANDTWYINIRNSATMAATANTSIGVRFLVVKIKSL